MPTDMPSMKWLAAAASALVLLAAMAVLGGPRHSGSGHWRGALTAGLLAVLLATPVLAQIESPPAPSASPSAEDAWHLATVEDPAPLGVREIVAWDQGFAALGWPRNAAMDDQGLTVPMWLSEDGATWRRSEQPIRLPSRTAIAMKLAAFDGDLLAFGSGGRRLLVWRSDDGQRWRRVGDRPAFAGKGIPRDIPYALQVMGALTANGRVVVSGQYGAPGDTVPIGRVWSSRDGRSWRFAMPDTPGGWPIYGLEAGPDGFLGMALDSRGCRNVGWASVRSGDGLDWERAARARRVCGLQAVVYDEHTEAFYATTFKNQRGAVLRSEDRRSWEEVHELTTELDGQALTLVPYALHAADGVIAVLGVGRTIDAEDNTIDHAFAAVSADGEDWFTTVDWPGTDAGHRASALGHGRLVVATWGGLWYADLADLGVKVTAPASGSVAGATSVGGTWRKLPESPFGAALGNGVWAGDEMIVSAFETKRIAGYDPRTKTWTRYPNAPYDLGLSPLVWTGREVVTGTSVESAEDVRRVLLAFDPAGPSWRELPMPSDEGVSLLRAGDRLIGVTGSQVVAYEPGTDSWSVLTESPSAWLRVGGYEWTGDELLVLFRGQDTAETPGRDGFVDVAVLDLETLVWRRAAPSPVSWTQAEQGHVWTGTELVLFTDKKNNERRTFHAAYDPATDTWRTIDAACRVPARDAVWTGRLVINGTKRAYEPATGACPRLPDRDDRTRNDQARVWTGREVIEWSGARGDDMTPIRDGIWLRPRLTP